MVDAATAPPARLPPTHQCCGAGCQAERIHQVSRQPQARCGGWLHSCCTPRNGERGQGAAKRLCQLARFCRAQRAAGSGGVFGGVGGRVASGGSCIPRAASADSPKLQNCIWVQEHVAPPPGVVRQSQAFFWHGSLADQCTVYKGSWALTSTITHPRTWRLNAQESWPKSLRHGRPSALKNCDVSGTIGL